MATDLAMIGFRADTSPLDKASQSLDKMAVKGGKAEKAVDKFGASVSTAGAQSSKASKGINQTNTALGGASRSAGQAGIQFQQFIGQVQAGQDPMLAFSQQAADIGIVLGAPMVGAVLGIAGSIGGALLPSLFSSSSEIEKLEKALESLDGVMSKTSNGTLTLSQRIAELSEVSEGLAKIEIAKGLIDARDAAKQAGNVINESFNENLKVSTSSIIGLSKNLDTLGVSATQLASGGVDELGAVFQNFNGTTAEYSELQNRARQTTLDLNDVTNRLASELNITDSQALSLVDSMGAFMREGTAINAAGLDSTIEQIASETGYANEAFVKFASTLTTPLKTFRDMTKLQNNLRQSMDDIYGSTEDGVAKLTAYEIASRELTSSLELELMALEQGEEAAKLHAIALSLGKESANELDQSIVKLVEKIERKKEADKKATEAQKELEKQQRETYRQNLAAAKSYANMIKSLEMQRLELTMTTDEFEEYKAVQQAIASGAAPEMIAQIRESVKALQDQRKAVANVEASLDQLFEDDSIFGRTADEVKELTDKTDEWAELTERQIDRIDSAFADVWMNVLDGADNVFDSLENSFKRMLAEMAHQALTKPIVLNIQQALNGGAGGISGILGSAGGGVGGIGNVLGLGGALTGLGGLIGGAGLGAFGSGLGASLGFLGTGQFGAMGSLFSGFAGAGSIGGALGAALPIAGIAAIAGTVVSDVLGLGSNWKLAEQKVTVEIVGDDFSGEVTTREKRKKLFKNRYRTSSEDIADEAFDALFGGVTDQIDMWGEKLGISQQKIDGFFDSFSKSLEFDTEGLSEDQIQQKINEFVATTSNAMIEGVFGELLGGIQREGESATTAINRIIASMELLERNAEIVGISIRGIGDGMAEAATWIAEAVGGIESLGQLTNLYYSEFVSEANKHGMISKQLRNDFEELNLELPLTRKGFQDLIKGLDLSTESGQEMYASLLRLIPGLDQFYDTIEQRQELANRVAEEEAREAERLAQQSTNLNIRLLEAQGKSEEALALSRQMELEQLDPTLRAIMQQIYAEQDLAKEREEAAKLAEQRQSLEIQLLKAQGEETEALARERERELEALDPSLRAIQRKIYAEQDLARQREQATKTLNARLSEASSVSVALNKMLINNSAGNAASNRADIDRALSAARQGDLSLAGNLSLDVGSAADFGGTRELAFAQAVAANKIAEIALLSKSTEITTQGLIQSINDNMQTQSSYIQMIPDANYDTNKSVINLTKELKAERQRAKKAEEELAQAFASLKATNESQLKYLRRIELNTYEATK